MLNRILYDPQSGKPVALSQDFLRSDYARIHTELDLGRNEPESQKRSPAEEVGGPALPVAG
jgi:hypothetical protein